MDLKWFAIPVVIFVIGLVDMAIPAGDNAMYFNPTAEDESNEPPQLSCRWADILPRLPNPYSYPKQRTRYEAPPLRYPSLSRAHNPSAQSSPEHNLFTSPDLCSSGQNFAQSSSSGQNFPQTSSSGQNFPQSSNAGQTFLHSNSGQNFPQTFNSGQNFSPLRASGHKIRHNTSPFLDPIHDLFNFRYGFWDRMRSRVQSKFPVCSRRRRPSKFQGSRFF